MAQETSTAKPIAATLTGTEVEEGEGMTIRRYFPSREAMQVDPFVLLDWWGRPHFAPGEAKGIPGHPHAGFELITYNLHGGFRHEDSLGNVLDADSGDVMWMTAGAGIVHAELPTQRLVEEGGRLEGFQLWINLPSSAKKLPPAMGVVQSEDVAEATSEDGLVRVRIVNGEALGARQRLGLHEEMTYLHLFLSPGGRFGYSLPADWSGFVLPIEGSVRVSGTELGTGTMGVLAEVGELVEVASAQGAQAILVAAKPLNERVVRYGPFVMNTMEEIQEAAEAYRSGRLGQVPSSS